MGQAKIRGDREQRIAEAVERREAERFRREADSRAFERMRAANRRMAERAAGPRVRVVVPSDITAGPGSFPRPHPAVHTRRGMARARMMAGALMAAIAGLSGCGRETKPDLPGSCAVEPSRIRTVTERVYVGIDPALTRREAIAEGPLSVCPQVSAERKAAIERLNGRMQQIEGIEGTPVPE